MIIPVGESETILRANGSRARIRYQVSQGPVTVSASVLEVSRSELRSRDLYQRRRRQVLQWLRGRIIAARDAGEITPAEAVALRDATRNGDFSALPAQLRTRLRAYLGREPLAITRNSSSNNGIETLMVTVGAPRSTREAVILIEAEAGATNAAELDIKSLEVE